MIYPIVVYGASVLKKKGAEIEFGTDVTELVNDMFETMYNANGIGLAAPQIGKSIRMFITDGKATEEPGMDEFKRVFINPTIIEENGDEWVFEEGCLSIPDIREEISRQQHVTVKWFDEEWKEHQESFDGLKARIIQHEFDHIEGVLFTDYLTPFKKRVLKGRLMNITKGRIKTDYRILAPMAK